MLKCSIEDERVEHNETRHKHSKDIEVLKQTTDDGNEKHREVIEKKQIQHEIAKNERYHYLSENSKQCEEIEALKQSIQDASTRHQNTAQEIQTIGLGRVSRRYKL